MPGHASSDREDWTALWSDAQQKYWRSWLDIAHQTSSPKEEPAPNSWMQGFDIWAKLVVKTVPLESREWVSKLAAVNRGYLHWGEQLWKALFEAQPASPEAWRDAISRGFKPPPDVTSKDPWAEFAASWGMPPEAWSRVYSACSTLPSDMEKALRGLAASCELPEGILNRWFSAPSLGYTREWQEDAREWQRLWLEHGQALIEYSRVLAGITTKAAETLGKKLYDLVSRSEMPETLRAFYNLWVDSGEEAYAEAAAQPEFIRTQARLVNTLMAVKRQEQKMVDEVLSSLNMPTRRELDATHRRVHQMRREIGQLREALDESDISVLREEVAGLRREIQALRAQAEPLLGEKRFTARGAKSAGKF